ncbi:hypothetical protein [Microtetraspora malaysiensis]|uniref:hypothetical protein n=1 Tax=Microtetraspora malaysiensis TaxID=161358 RepID=UPI003D90D42B
MLRNTTRFRRVATGTLLIVAPLLQLVAVIVDPGTWGGDREAVGYVVSFPVPYSPLTILFWTLPVVALGAFGVKVLRMGDGAWAAYYPASPGLTTPDSYAKTTA